MKAKFSVSRPTAARALRELQTAGLVERRAGSGTYVKAATQQERQLSFGLLVPGLGNTEILDPVCNEITRAAQGKGATVLWGPAVSGVAGAEAGRALCESYINAKVDGVFFAPFENVADRQAVNLGIVEMLSAAGIAVVLLDRDVLEFPDRGRHDLVSLDNFQAGFVITRHLLELGHRNLRFLARPLPPSTTDLRLAGCREAAARRGIFFRPEWVVYRDPASVDEIRSLIEPGTPDAVICSNDQTAALLSQSLARLGKRVPSDIAVVGFDDVNYSTLLATPLTTMRQPTREIGRLAVQAMLERLKNLDLPARQLLLSATLIVRQSCGAAQRVT